MKKLILGAMASVLAIAGASAADVNQGVQDVLNSQTMRQSLDSTNQHYFNLAGNLSDGNLITDIGDYMSGKAASQNLQDLAQNAGDLVNHLVANDIFHTNAIVANADAINNLNGRVDTLDSKMDTLNKDLKSGIAGIAALSSVSVTDVKKGEVSVGGGYGSYAGQNAMAFGAVVGLMDNWSVNAGLSFSGADNAYRVGTNYKFKAF